MSASLASSARWMSGAQAVKVGVQVSSIAVLARILGPEQYGIMAMATTVTNFGILFRDMGTGAAIIQRTDIDEELCSSAHWFSLLSSSVVCLLICLFAPFAAHIFQTPSLTIVLILLGLTFPCVGASTVRQALLERNGSFRDVALIEITSVLLAFAVATVVAINGGGVFSLVAQAWTMAITSTILLRLLAKWKPTSRLKLKPLLLVSRFSGSLFAFNFINYFSRNADAIIVGQRIGAEALGSYSLAYRVMLFPIQNLTTVASRTLYPGLSRNQSNPIEMERIYLRSVQIIASLSAPLMAGLFVLRHEFLQVVFGSEWTQTSQLIAILAPVGFIQSIVSTTGTVYMARGRTDILLRLGIFSCILQVSGFFIGSMWGVTGVAASYLISNAINAIPCLWITLRQVGSAPLALIEALSIPILAAGMMALVLQLNAPHYFMDDASVHLRLFAQVLVGVASYFLIFACLLSLKRRVLETH